VRRGETLAQIANNYGIEVQDLKAWNHLHVNKCKPGQKLKLSGHEAENTFASAGKHHHTHITYKVKTGDTLSGIAERFDASVASIRELNGLKKGKLQPGMKIRI
jgi:membrane-bound lytic murein transglycosylase D